MGGKPARRGDRRLELHAEGTEEPGTDEYRQIRGKSPIHRYGVLQTGRPGILPRGEATGTTILHITHHYEDVYDLAEQVAVLQGGRVVQAGTAEEIFRRPATEFVARFVGHENLVRCTSRSCSGMTCLEVPGTAPIYTTVQVEAERDIIAVIPQTDIALSHRPDADAVNTRIGTVTALTAAGGIVRVAIEAGFPMTVFLTRQQYKEGKFQIGDEIFAAFSPDVVHLITVSENTRL